MVPSLTRDFFSNEFVGQYDVRDPRTGAQLALGEMVKQGLVNEVWIITSGDETHPPAESAESKQAYDDHFNKLSGKFVRAGNGGDDKSPNIGRSLRFISVNITKARAAQWKVSVTALKVLQIQTPFLTSRIF